MELTTIENGQLNKVDYESLIEKIAKMILKNKKRRKSKQHEQQVPKHLESNCGKQ